MRRERLRAVANRAEAEMIPPPPTNLAGTGRNPVGCREKLRMLAENHAEVAQVLQDAFEDADTDGR